MLKTRNVKFPIPKAPQLQIMNITNFKGMDLTENPFNVDYNSASDLLNLYINKSGVLTLRPRTEIVYDLKERDILNETDDLITLYKKNNGEFIYHILRDDIAYILYLKDNDVHTAVLDDDVTLPKTKIIFFEKEDVLYMLTQNGYMLFDGTKVYMVKDHEDTYVPMTRVGRSLSSEFVIDSNGIRIPSGTSFEPLNLLNKKYKESYFFEYSDVEFLDFDIDIKDYYKSNYFDETFINYEKVYLRINEYNRLVVDTTTNKLYLYDNNSDVKRLITDIDIDTERVSISPKGNYMFIYSYIPQTGDNNYKIVKIKDDINSVITVTNYTDPLHYKHSIVTDTGLIYLSPDYDDIEIKKIYVMKEDTDDSFSIFTNFDVTSRSALVDISLDSIISPVDNSLAYVHGTKLYYFDNMRTGHTDPNIEILMVDEFSLAGNRTYTNVVLLKNNIIVKDHLGYNYNNSKYYIVNIKDNFEYDIINKKNEIMVPITDNRSSYLKLIGNELYYIRSNSYDFTMYVDGDFYNKDSTFNKLMTRSPRDESVFQPIDDDLIPYYNNGFYLSDNKTIYTVITKRDNMIPIENDNIYTKALKVEYNQSIEPLIVFEKTLTDEEYKNLLFCFDGYERFDNEYFFFGNNNTIYHTLNNNPTYIPDYGERIIGNDDRIVGFNIAGLNTLVALKQNKSFVLTHNEVSGFKTYNITELKTTIGDITINNSIVANYTNIPIVISNNTIYGMYNNEDASTLDYYYTSISDKINKKFSIEKNKNTILTHNHDYLTYFIIKNINFSKVYVLDNRTMEWFYWELPVEIEGLWEETEVSDTEVEDITLLYDKYGFVYKLTTKDGFYIFKKNYVDHNDNIIKWTWVSQINPLGSINYMKQLKSTSFIFTDSDSEDDFNLDYAIEVYKKTINSPKAYTIRDELTYIRSVNKKTYIPKLSFIRLILSNTEGSVYDYDNKTGLPVNWYNNKINLLGISFKYNLLGELM